MATSLCVGNILENDKDDLHRANDLGSYVYHTVRAGILALVRRGGATEKALDEKHKELKQNRETVIEVVEKLPPVLDRFCFTVLMDSTVHPLEERFSCKSEGEKGDSYFVQADRRLRRLLKAIGKQAIQVEIELNKFRTGLADARNSLLSVADTTDHEELAQNMFEVSYGVNTVLTDAARALDYILKARHARVEPPGTVFREWEKRERGGAARAGDAAQLLAGAGRDAFFQLEVMAEQVVHNQTYTPTVKRNLDVFMDILCLPSACGGRQTRLRVEKLLHHIKARIEQERLRHSYEPVSSRCCVFDVLLSCILNTVEDVDAARVLVDTEAEGSARWRSTLQYISQLGHLSSRGNRLALSSLWVVLKDEKDWVMRETAMLELGRLSAFDRLHGVEGEQRLPSRDVEATVSKIAEVKIGRRGESHEGESHEMKRSAYRVLSGIIASAPRTDDGDRFVKKIESRLLADYAGEAEWAQLFRDAHRDRPAPRAARRTARHEAQHQEHQEHQELRPPTTLHDPFVKNAVQRMHPALGGGEEGPESAARTAGPDSAGPHAMVEELFGSGHRGRDQQPEAD